MRVVQAFRTGAPYAKCQLPKGQRQRSRPERGAPGCTRHSAQCPARGCRLRTPPAGKGHLSTDGVGSRGITARKTMGTASLLTGPWGAGWSYRRRLQATRWRRCAFGVSKVRADPTEPSSPPVRTGDASAVLHDTHAGSEAALTSDSWDRDADLRSRPRRRASSLPRGAAPQATGSQRTFPP